MRNQDIVNNTPDVKTRSLWPLFLLISLPVIPASFLGLLLFCIFFLGLKWKPIMHFLVANILLVTTFILSKIFHPFGHGIIYSYLYICVYIGVVIYFFLSLIEARRLKNDPALKVIRGQFYKFEYVKTPFEKKKKEKLIKRIENGEEYSTAGAPLGVLDDAVIREGKAEPFDKPMIVRKYYKEANTHTIVTGASGSGKALHEDTLIPTLNGFKLLSEVEVGDMLYDEAGFNCKVLEKFHPFVKKSYDMTFIRVYRGYEERESILACEDHLWEVNNRKTEKTEVKSTRSLYQKLKNDPYLYVLVPLKEGLVCRDSFVLSSLSETFNTCNKILEKGEDVFIENGLSLYGDLRNYYSSLGYFVGFRDITLCISKKAGRLPYFISLHQQKKTAKEEFYCLTVSSPSHLFLCTPHFLPTHNTVSLLSQVKNDIEVGVPVIFIDCKGANDVSYFLAKWAKEHGRKFYHFSKGPLASYKNPYNPKGPASYDPLGSGDYTYKTDMLLGLREWTANNEFFYGKSRDILFSVSFLLDEMKRIKEEGIVDTSALKTIRFEDGNLASFADALTLDGLYRLVTVYNADYAIRAKEGHLAYGEDRTKKTVNDLYKEVNLAKDPTRKKEQMDTYQSNLSGILLSSYGEWMIRRPESPSINLLESTSNGKGDVILFSLAILDDGRFAEYISSMILGNLRLVAGERNRRGAINPVSVYIDEVQNLDIRQLSGILEKSRSAKMGATLSLQTLNQISAGGKYPKEMVDGILDTCSNFLVHSGSGQDTAEYYSKIIGQYEKIKPVSNSNINSGIFAFNFFNRRQANVKEDTVAAYVVPPEKFQTLSKPGSENNYKATAYYITKRCDEKIFAHSSRPVARRVQIVAEKEITGGVPDDALVFMQGQKTIPRKKKRKKSPSLKDPPSSHIALDDGNFTVEKIPSSSQNPKRPSLPQKASQNPPQKKETIKEKKSPRSGKIHEVPKGSVKTHPKPKITAKTRKAIEEYEQALMPPLPLPREDREELPDPHKQMFSPKEMVKAWKNKN